LTNLVHTFDELINFSTSVSGVTTFHEVSSLVLESTEGRVQFERPQEVVGFLEVCTASVDFVDEIFNTDDVLVSEALLDDGVISQWDTLLVDLSVSSFVDEVGDGFQGRFTVSDIWFDGTEHSHGGVVDLHEDGVVDLTKTEKLEDLLGLRSYVHDTLNTDNKEDLGSRLNVVVSLVLSLTLHADGGTFGISVFFDVLFGTFEDNTTSLLALLGLLGSIGFTLSGELGKALSLFQE